MRGTALQMRQLSLELAVALPFALAFQLAPVVRSVPGDALRAVLHRTHRTAAIRVRAGLVVLTVDAVQKVDAAVRWTDDLQQVWSALESRVDS